MNRRRYYCLITTGVIVVVGCLFILLTLLFQPWSSINAFLTDQLFSPQRPSPNIVIAGIDDNALKTHGKWSEWPRTLHAKAIDNLSAAGALVIGFDVLFADASSADPVLAKSLKDAGNVVLAGVGADSLTLDRSMLAYERILWPETLLEHAAHGIGHANINPDSDGVVRKLPVVIKDKNGNVLPALSVAMIYTAFSQDLPRDYVMHDGKLRLCERDIPVDNYNRIRVNYTDPEGSYTCLSYGDIIAGTFDPSIVKNKIVLVGMTATGDIDTWGTPVSVEKKPGVWIHANVMDTILRQRFLIEANWPVTLLIMLLFVAIAACALPRMKLKWGALLIAGMIAGYAAAAFFAFDNGHILNLLYPTMLLPLLYIAAVLCTVICEQSHKQLIKDLFGRYVSPQVASKILELDDGGNLQLGGEKRTVTVLFADIRGFTRMSEQMSPEEVVSMLNTYLSLMIERVIANDGIVNKFAGDNIMGVWNAPQEQENHALLAVKAAVESQQAIVKKQEEDPSLPKVQFGIGINTGDAIAGNMGSVGRSEYTVIGDAVNLSSRICSAAHGGETWIGPETYRQTMGSIEVEELPPQTFKGKAEQVIVYKVIEVKK